MFNIYMPFYPIPRAPFFAITGIHLQISIEPKSTCVSSHSRALHVIHQPHTPCLLAQKYSPSFPGWILVEENLHHNKPIRGKVFMLDGWEVCSYMVIPNLPFSHTWREFLPQVLGYCLVEVLLIPDAQKPSWSYNTLLDNSLWARSWMLFTDKTPAGKYYLILEYKGCHNPCSIFA